jgi:uncharacterized protein YdhG (YjbR/CyaY superfamily)
VTAKTVDDYIASAPEETRASLSRLREVVREAAPEAEEVISYRMPLYKLDGHLVAFAAWKDHCSFYVMSSAVLEAHKGELQPYVAEKTTLHFPHGDPIPRQLVKKLVKERIAENSAARAAREAAKAGKGKKG